MPLSGDSCFQFKPIIVPPWNNFWSQHLVLSVFYFSHSSECVAVYRCDINLHLSNMTNGSGHLFICLFSLYIFLSEVIIQIFCPCFVLNSLCCWVVRVLYVLWIQLLYKTYVLQIISLSLWLVFLIFKWCPEKSKNF